MPGTEEGCLKNRAAGKSRLSSYTFPRVVEIGRRLLPIFYAPRFWRNFSDLETPTILFSEPPSSQKSKN